MSPKLHILVVDDDPAVLSSLSFMLEAEGFEVLAIGDVGDLLSCGSICQQDCVVLDYAMPVMNGFDVLQWLRDKKINAPAIMITARPEARLRERALQAGFARVVEKPLLDRALADDIRQVIGSPRQTELSP
ncbi:MAG: response regulator [Beijerinckiaceae bacterium]